ncbi:MAG TPA: hypothetical protein VKY65_05755 [Alphaproteobacteria bacterium]|nr:hypothetical protein [Alphaproteobacteria bacterium]
MPGKTKRAKGAGKNLTAEQLLEEFVAVSERQYAGYDVDDYKGSARAVHRLLALVKELDEVAPGRTVLLPFLDHPNMAVRVNAGTFLCRMMPDRALPVLQKLKKMNTREELSQPHALNAQSHASNTIFIYERGELKV